MRPTEQSPRAANWKGLPTSTQSLAFIDLDLPIPELGLPGFVPGAGWSVTKGKGGNIPLSQGGLQAYPA